MNPSPVLFIPHGGGPLPLLGDKGHQELVRFLENIPRDFETPDAILVISAHWEESKPTITSGKLPPLIYDYYGFPEESYEIQYPAPGSPKLASRIHALLTENKIEAALDDQRGFDHGLFVPLKIMYPDATIPCVQLSLVHNLDAGLHIEIGKALSALRNENVLILGSGFSFHNLKAMLRPGQEHSDTQNIDFENWLIGTCTDPSLGENERANNLVHWERAPFARYCHPREEHLLPLHVCYGAGQSAARLEFDGTVIGKKTSAYLW
jgi:4,5-DOPA dioxygenase extradiol